jgi:hypothetical protein
MLPTHRSAGHCADTAGIAEAKDINTPVPGPASAMT